MGLQSVRSFFAFYRMELKIRKGIVPEVIPTLGDHKLTKEELAKMYAVGDIFEKALISTAEDLALRSQDFAVLQ